LSHLAIVLGHVVLGKPVRKLFVLSSYALSVATGHMELSPAKLGKKKSAMGFGDLLCFATVDGLVSV